MTLHYNPSSANPCPGCTQSQWHVGRITAECACCGTTLPIRQGYRPPRHDSEGAEAAGHYLSQRPSTLGWRLRLAAILALPPFNWSFRGAWDYAASICAMALATTCGDPIPAPREALAEDMQYWEG